MKSPINNPTTDLSGTSSNTNSNVVETKTAVKRKRAKKSQTSKTVEEMSSQELPYDNKKPQKFPKSNAEENDSMKQIIENGTLQSITNITEKDLQTSTPKVTKKTAKKRGSTTENKKPKMKDSENKSKKDVQRKERQKISKKNTKDKQGESKSNLNYIFQFLHISQMITLNNKTVIFFR